MGTFTKRRWQPILVAFVFTITSVSTLLTQSASAIAGDIEPWQMATNSLPVGKTSVGSVELNGYLYVIGGRNASTITSETSVHYSQVNNSGNTSNWTSTSSLPEGFGYTTTAFTKNGYIYAVGNIYYPDTNDNLVSIYYAQANSDGSLGQWTVSTSKAARGGPAVVVVNDYIYLAGGLETNPDPTVTYDQNPPTQYARINSDGSIGAWQTSAYNLPSPALFPHAVTKDGHIYLIGGIASLYASEANKSIFMTKVNSDGSIDPWTTSGEQLPEPTVFGSATVVGNYIYMTGGSQDAMGNIANDTTYFSLINSNGTINSWQTSANSLPEPKNGLTTMTAGSRIYTIGGWGSNYDSTDSTSVYFTNVSPQSLAIPTNLSSPTPTKQKPSLSWTGVSGATSYTVYRNGNSVGTSTTTSFTDTALATDGNYTYTVSASNGSVTSPQSASVSVQYDSTLPTTTNGTINGWLVINWGNPVITADVSDALSGITGGEYYIDNDPGQSSGTPMTYANGKISAQPIITTGTAGGWHTIYMRSKDAAGNWSTPTSVRFFFF